MLRKWIIAIALITFSFVIVRAQVYPVEVISNLNQPTTAFLSDYTDVGSNMWSNTFILKDNTAGSIGVKFRISIESGALRIATKPTYIPPQPVILASGIPTVLNGFDLANYFDYNNLDFIGISRQQIQQNGKLPEGFYTFCIEALEYNSSKVISRQTCASTYIQLKDQPLVINPQCGTAVTPSAGQNIVFQWQNSGPVSPDPANQNQYRLRILEVTDQDVDPFLAINNQKVFQIFETNLSPQTNYTYTLSDPILDLGKRYVFTIQAEDARGTISFKNDGLSEICWFSYGYPQGGKIEIDKPAASTKFNKVDPLIFKWGAISNAVAGQQVVYDVKWCMVNNGQTAEQAIANNSAVKAYSSSTLPATTGFEHMLDSLPKGKKFAWQVTATSGSQLVAESEIYTFTTPPAIDEIQAGNQMVYVTELENTNPNSLKGSGQLKMIKGADTTMVDLQFENLKATLVAGRYVLDEGEILVNSPVDTIGLISQNSAVPNGVFQVDQLRINKDGLYIKGVAKIPLPLAVNAGSAAYLVSESNWINYNSYSLKGGLKANDQNTFSLLDPYSFEINYNTTSDIIINNNEFVLKLFGTITLHQDVKTVDDNAVVINFYDQNNFSYNVIDNIQETHICPLPNTKAQWVLKKVVLDLSEAESPGSKQSEQAWMGVYVEEAELLLTTDFDEGAQLYGVENYTTAAGIGDAAVSMAHIDGTGLNFEFNQADLGVVFLYSFGSSWDKLNLKVVENVVESGKIEVSFALPLLSSSNVYTATMPLTDAGVEKAFLPSDFSGQIVFDEDNEKRRTVIDVLAGRFDDEGLLDLDVNVKNEHMKVEVKNIPHLKINGYDQFGFNSIGGSYILESPLKFNLENLQFNLISISTGAYQGIWGLGFDVQGMLGPSVTGVDGVPQTTMAAMKKAPAATGKAQAVKQKTEKERPTVNIVPPGEYSNVQVQSSIEILEEGMKSGSSGVAIDENGFAFGFELKINAVVAYFNGYFHYQHSTELGGIWALGGGVETDAPHLYGFPIDDMDGQMILGTHIAKNGAPKPIMLARLNVAVGGIAVLFPHLQISQFAIALGTFAAPETYISEDFVAPAEMRWHIDLNTPFSLYGSFTVQDGLEVSNLGVAGIIYIARLGGGFRMDSSDPIDFDNPSTLKNLQICLSGLIDVRFLNLDAIPYISMVLGEWGALRGSGSFDYCIGKEFDLKTKLRGQLRLTIPLFPPGLLIMPGLLSMPYVFCGEGIIDTRFNVDFEEVINGNYRDHTIWVDIGTRERPWKIDHYCLGIANPIHWQGLGMKNGQLIYNIGFGIRTTYHLGLGIDLGFTGARADFNVNSDLIAETTFKINFEDFNTPNAYNNYFRITAEFLAQLKVSYKFLLREVEQNIGRVYLLADGRFGYDNSAFFIEGDFRAEFHVINKQFNARFSDRVNVLQF